MSSAAMHRKRVRTSLPPVFLFLFALSSAAACEDITGSENRDFPQPEAGELKVLFIGASYLEVNNLPGLFKEMAVQAEKDIYVAARALSGHYLDYFAQEPTTSEAIGAQEWDYVVLSGGCQTAAYPDTHHLINDRWGRHDPWPALQELNRKVKENHPGTVLVYMMPWAFEDGMTWIPGQGDDYFEMQRRIRENALAWADSLGMVVAPVGMAWKEVMEWGVPEHFLHMSDWNHPSARGSYLSAATIYSTLYRESAESVQYNWLLSQADALGLRRVASQVVLDSLALWNNVR